MIVPNNKTPLEQLINSVTLGFDIPRHGDYDAWGRFCAAHARSRAIGAAAQKVLELPFDEAGMRAFLMRETSDLPVRVHGVGDHRYMERYFLYQNDDYRVLVHRFMHDDDDLGPHDHPWPFGISVLLAGAYDEVYVTNPATRETTLNHRGMGSLGLLNNSDLHRVTLPRDERGQPIDCWTLFIHANHFPKGWGIWVDGHHEGEAAFAQLSGRRAYRSQGLGRGRDSLYFVQKGEPQGESWWEATHCLRGRDLRLKYGEPFA